MKTGRMSESNCPAHPQQSVDFLIATSDSNAILSVDERPIGKYETCREKLASRLRFSPEFAHKVADEIAPGTTVIVTDAPAVRKPVVDSTYFATS